MDNLNNTNYEPMDIDLSAHSNNAMDISFNSSSLHDIDINWEADTSRMHNPEPAAIGLTVCPAPHINTQQITNVKTFHIKIHKKTSSHTSTKIKVICVAVVLLTSIMTYQVLNINCSGDINLDELHQSLSSRLYGQTRAINSLIEALSVRERSKIVILYGGTGVGKTFTASLILEQVGLYSNVYHYIMPSFMDTFSTDFMIGLTVCKHSIIILDDLTAKDMNVRAHIENVITKSQDLDKNITVILIYNCDNTTKDFERQCDETFPSKLLHNFSYIDAFKKLIKFEPLQEEHLRMCIEAELGIKKLMNNEFEKISKNLNVSLDGCKGVYTKVKFSEVS